MSGNTPTVVTVGIPISTLTTRANNPGPAALTVSSSTPAGYTTSPPDSIYGATPSRFMPGSDNVGRATATTPISVPGGTVAASGNPNLGVNTTQATDPTFTTAAPAWGGPSARATILPATGSPTTGQLSSDSWLLLGAVGLVVAFYALEC